MTKKKSEVMLILSAEEYDYLFKLMLDYGQYAPPDHVRIPLVKKLASPMRIKDMDFGSKEREARAEDPAAAELIPQGG